MAQACGISTLGTNVYYGRSKIASNGLLMQDPFGSFSAKMIQAFFQKQPIAYSGITGNGNQVPAGLGIGLPPESYRFERRKLRSGARTFFQRNADVDPVFVRASRGWQAAANLQASKSVASQMEVAGSRGPVVHRVKQGETLWDIAVNYGTTIEAIMAVNGIEDGNLVMATSNLVIPPSLRRPPRSSRWARMASRVRERVWAAEADAASPVESGSGTAMETEADSVVAEPEDAEEAAAPLREERERLVASQTVPEEPPAATWRDAGNVEPVAEPEAAEEKADLVGEEREALVASQTMPEEPPGVTWRAAGNIGRMAGAFLGSYLLLAGLVLAAGRVREALQRRRRERLLEQAESQQNMAITKARFGKALRIDRVYQPRRLNGEGPQVAQASSAAASPKESAATGGVSEDRSGNGSQVPLREPATEPVEVNPEEAMAAIQRDYEEIRESFDTAAYQEFLRDSGALQRGRFQGGMPRKFRERGKG